MEPAANSTQVDAFHASFQAFLENVLVPECLGLLWDRTINWTVQCVIVLAVAH